MRFAWLLLLGLGFAPSALAAPCGDVNRSGGVNAADVSALRQAMIGSGASLAAPGNCNLRGPAYPRDLDANGLPDECTLVDLVVLRRGLASLAPGLQTVCAGDDFAPALGASALTLPLGASVNVRVALYRHVSLPGNVTVSLAPPLPQGIAAGTLVFGPDSGDGFLSLQAEPGVPLGGPIQVQVSATNGAITRSVPLALTVAAAAASSQSLIEAALVAGTLDYGTSLLYRGWALVGDPRLPAAYVGSGSVDEDPSLFHEIEIATVSPALRAQLDTLMRRPTETGSIYRPTLVPPPPGPPAVLPPPAPPSDPPCYGFSGFHVSSRHATLPVTAHAYCRSAYDGPAVNQALSDTLGAIATSWSAMTQLMGDPRADLTSADLADPALVEQRGGGPEIDVYVVDNGDAEREGRTVSFGTALAYARSSPPDTGNGSSGYLVVRRDRLANGGFRSDLVHEFFHVLQFRHNRRIFNLCEPVGSRTLCRQLWFTEASATWAERRFVPETAAAEVHNKRFPMVQSCTPSGGGHLEVYSRFQCNDASLNASVGSGSPLENHMYAAYVWPSFMEQQAGQGAIATAWQGLAGVGANDYGTAMAAIGAPVPFAANFRRFAVRNLNTLFPAEYGVGCAAAGCENPIGTRYPDLPPGDFGAVDYKLPRFDLEHDFAEPLAASAPPRSVADSIAALKAHYYHFTLDGGGTPDPEVRPRWELDFTNLTPKTSLGIDAIVRKNDDTWEWRQNLQPDADGKVSLCDVSEVYLVLSNAAIEDVPRENARRIQGTYTIAPRETPCACNHVAVVQEWNATASFNWQTSGSNADASAQAYHAGNVTFRFVQTDVGVDSVVWQGTQLAGQITIDDHSEVDFGGTEPYVLDDYYLRPPDPELTGLQLAVDLQTCRYNFWVLTEAGGPMGGPRALPSGDYRTDPVASLRLAGGGLFPAWTRLLSLDDGFAMGGGTALVLVIQPPPGGNPFGVIPDGGTRANVSWSFEPIRPPP
jgi:hypothetical protein